MEQKSTDILPKELRYTEYELIKFAQNQVAAGQFLKYHEALEAAEAEIESLKTLLEESEKEKERLKGLIEKVYFAYGDSLDFDNHIIAELFKKFKKENNLE